MRAAARGLRAAGWRRSCEGADRGSGVPCRNPAGDQHLGRVVAGQRVFEGGREALGPFRPHPVQLLQPRRADLLRPGDPRSGQLRGQGAAEAGPQARRQNWPNTSADWPAACSASAMDMAASLRPVPGRRCPAGRRVALGCPAGDNVGMAGTVGDPSRRSLQSVPRTPSARRRWRRCGSGSRLASSRRAPS